LEGRSAGQEKVMITKKDFELFKKLVERADKSFDGHLTVMKFTTTWRVGFVTPDGRDGIADMPVGNTFTEAARKALGEVHP
jgi:hypothetical protein